MLRRTPLKRTPLKRSPTKKQTLKLQKQKGRGTEDKLLYLEIWREREHICWATGKYLGEEPLTTMFHHVLPKEENKFPQYRHEKWNIILLSPDVHNQVEIDINKVPKVRELYLELLEKHTSFAQNQII